MPKQIQVSVQETAEKTTTQTIVVAPGVEVCRITVERKSGGKRTTTTTEKVRSTSKTTCFSVVEPELIEKLRMTGWLRDADDFKLIVQKPFTRITDPDKKPYRIVQLKNDDHSLYALDGGRLPVGMHLDYMGGQGNVNSYHFDLAKLLVHLQKRKDVTLHTERFSDRIIQPVPHYNRGGTSGSMFIAFTWHPGVKLFREFVQQCVGTDRFFRFDVAHKLMGNDQFRIEPPKETENNDDDED